VRPRRQTAAGFTLLEVMVAIAILALSLTAIFSSEAGAIKMAHRARKMGLATLLARCKMGEIEEQVAAEGLPAVDDSGTDACCEDGELEGFTCDWEIKPVVLPDTMFAPEDDDQGAGDGSDPMAKVSAALGLAPGGDQSASTASTASTGPGAGGVDPTQLLTGQGAGGLAAMALSFVYPVLKPSFESQIRRATVTVRWKEGSVDHDFDVTQYLVSDQPIPMDGLDANGQPLQPGQSPVPVPVGGPLK